MDLDKNIPKVDEHRGFSWGIINRIIEKLNYACRITFDPPLQQHSIPGGKKVILKDEYDTQPILVLDETPDEKGMYRCMVVRALYDPDDDSGELTQYEFTEAWCYDPNMFPVTELER